MGHNEIAFLFLMINSKGSWRTFNLYNITSHHMKPLFILLLLTTFALQLLICPSAIAQRKAHDGYIILNSLDTLHGEIALQSDVSYSMQCLFKKSGDEKFQIYTAEMIKEYRFYGGRKFQSAASLGIKEIENSFLEFLVNGRFSTYAYYQPDLNTRFFGRIEDEDVFELKNTTSVIKTDHGKQFGHERKEYIGVLNYKLQDYPYTSQRLNNMHLNRNNLVKLAADYHQHICHDTECVVYVAEKRKPEIKIGIISNFPLISVKNPFGTNIIASSTPGFGLSFNLTDLPLISKNFSLQADFSYTKQYFEVDEELLIKHFIYDTPTDLFTISVIRIPVVFKYTFNVPRVKPFVGAGASFSFREIDYTGKPYVIGLASRGYSGREIGPQLGLNIKTGANLNINRYFSIEYAAILERNSRFFSRSVSDTSYSEQLIHCFYLWYKI
jgi:hypothetical protein